MSECTNVEEALSVVVRLKCAADALGVVLQEVLGNTASFALYIHSERFRGVLGNLDQAECIPLLRQMIAACEERQAAMNARQH